MAKKASGTSLAIRHFLNELPADVYKETKVDDLLVLVKSQKSVETALKKQNLTDSSIKQLIQKIKKERGLVRGSESAPAPVAAKKSKDQKGLFVQEVQPEEIQREEIPAVATAAPASTDQSIDHAVDLIRRAAEELSGSGISIGDLVAAVQTVEGYQSKLAEYRRLVGQ